MTDGHVDRDLVGSDLDVPQWTRLALDRFFLLRSESGANPPVFYEFDHHHLVLRSRHSKIDALSDPADPTCRREWRIALDRRDPDLRAAFGTCAALRTDGGGLVMVTNSPRKILLDLVAAGTTALIGYENEAKTMLARWISDLSTGRFGDATDLSFIGSSFAALSRGNHCTHIDSLDHFDIDEIARELGRPTRNERRKSQLFVVHSPASEGEEKLLRATEIARRHPHIGIVIVGPSELAEVVVVATHGAGSNAIFESFPIEPAHSCEIANNVRGSTTHQLEDVYVCVLGPVEIRNIDDRLAHRPKLTELVVYLTMHHGGATTRAWSNALWPDRRVPPQTIANRLSEARRALGFASDDKPRLRRNGERHAVSAVRSDWEEFCELTRIGTNSTQWRNALELVRGRPFEGLQQDQWTVIEGYASEIEQRIVDCALAYGEDALQSGRPEEAAWAAQAGLRANPWEERLHRLLMRSADASGNRAGIDHALRHLALVMEIDGNPLEGVHPQTAALYTQLTTRSPARSGRRANADEGAA